MKPASVKAKAYRKEHGYLNLGFLTDADLAKEVIDFKSNLESVYGRRWSMQATLRRLLRAGLKSEFGSEI